MSVNNDHNGFGHLDPAFHWQAPGSAANDQDVFLDGPLVELGDPPPPPLGVELTCYRLLNVTTVILWVVPKAILSYKNRSVGATTVDLLAALFGVMLYLVGLYEQIPGNNWEWFFHADLAPALGHSARYFIRAVHQALSFLVHMLGYLFILLALFNMCWVTVFPGIMLTDSPLTSFILVVTIGPAFLSKCLFIYWLIYYC